ncbi:hypothetical protein GGQ68_004849 [Sagittula marina]|uniref:Uncharacterized protein n=1 Tax=Sagittula marina TaxID=943940 RepID=A0A7W6DT41_9RHOB|nr:hypothetical protein [Sagittula marina]MBB3988492.1 hypothetical protein [Sagittula marina]
MTIRGLLYTLPIVVAGWLLTLMSVSLLTDEAPAQVVVFPSESFMQSLPADVAILGRNDISVTLTAPRTSFAASLYRSGARIVLPAGLPGCLPLSR